MSDLRLRARSVTEIVDAAFQLYKRDAVEYMLVTAVAYAPWVVAQLLILRGLTIASMQQLGASSSATFALGIVGLFAYALMSAVLNRFSSDVYLDQPTGLAQVIRAVLPRVPRVIGATILFGLLVTLGFVPIVIATATGAALQSVVMILAGFALMIVWVLYALARFFAVFQLIVLENRGVVAAFSRSGMLSRSRKGHIVLTLLLVLTIFVLLSLAVTMVGQLLGSVAVAVVLQSLYTVVAYPLIGITQMLLYYDARIRAEGFDIEVMTGALGPATPTAP